MRFMIIVGFAFILVQQALAYGQGWRLEAKQTSIDQRGSAVGDYSYASYSLSTTDPTKTGISFSCSDRFGLKLTLSLQPEAEGVLQPRGNVQMETRRTKFEIEGRKSERVAWTFVRELRLLQTRQQVTAKKFYNAAVTKKSFEIKEPFGPMHTVSFPPIDDSFKDFARACGLMG
ncbi:MAG: hypothetical protein AAGF20_06550 [Pseudomonadota bacterium]